MLKRKASAEENDYMINKVRITSNSKHTSSANHSDGRINEEDMLDISICKSYGNIMSQCQCCTSIDESIELFFLIKESILEKIKNSIRKLCLCPNDNFCCCKQKHYQFKGDTTNVPDSSESDNLYRTTIESNFFFIYKDDSQKKHYLCTTCSKVHSTSNWAADGVYIPDREELFFLMKVHLKSGEHLDAVKSLENRKNVSLSKTSIKSTKKSNISITEDHQIFNGGHQDAVESFENRENMTLSKKKSKLISNAKNESMGQHTNRILTEPTRRLNEEITVNDSASESGDEPMKQDNLNEKWSAIDSMDTRITSSHEDEENSPICASGISDAAGMTIDAQNVIDKFATTNANEKMVETATLYSVDNRATRVIQTNSFNNGNTQSNNNVKTHLLIHQPLNKNQQNTNSLFNPNLIATQPNTASGLIATQPNTASGLIATQPNAASGLLNHYVIAPFIQPSSSAFVPTYQPSISPSVIPTTQHKKELKVIGDEKKLWNMNPKVVVNRIQNSNNTQHIAKDNMQNDISNSSKMLTMQYSQRTKNSKVSNCQNNYSQKCSETTRKNYSEMHVLKALNKSKETGDTITNNRNIYPKQYLGTSELPKLKAANKSKETGDTLMKYRNIYPKQSSETVQINNSELPILKVTNKSKFTGGNINQENTKSSSRPATNTMSINESKIYFTIKEVNGVPAMVPVNAKNNDVDNEEPLVSNDTEPLVSNDAEPLVSNDAEPLVSNDAEPSVSNDAEPLVSNDALLYCKTEPMDDEPDNNTFIELNPEAEKVYIKEEEEEEEFLGFDPIAVDGDKNNAQAHYMRPDSNVKNPMQKGNYLVL